MVRQNLNTFPARNGVFGVKGFAKTLAARLADPDEIRKARSSLSAHDGVEDGR